jgi:hypothetical protein
MEVKDTNDVAKLKAEAKPTQKISLGLEELAEIIKMAVSSAVGQQSESSAKIIAEALIEARKPYKDPRTEANDAMMRKQGRETWERIQKEIEDSRKTCAHLQGSNALSEFQGQLGSFVMHQLDTGAVVGICTNCQKQIWSNNPEDHVWFSRKSANRMSRAGQRVFIDPLKAQQAR